MIVLFIICWFTPAPSILTSHIDVLEVDILSVCEPVADTIFAWKVFIFWAIFLALWLNITLREQCFWNIFQLILIRGMVHLWGIWKLTISIFRYFILSFICHFILLICEVTPWSQRLLILMMQAFFKQNVFDALEILNRVSS